MNTVRAIACALALMAAPSAWAGPRVLFDTDFGAPGKPFAEVDAARGNRITGSLPDGWIENSGWKSRVVAVYRPLADKGGGYLHISQASGDGLQFTHAVPAIQQQAGYYRITLTARSTVGATLGLRFAGPPYSTVWSAAPAMDARWRTFSFDMRVAKQAQEVGLFIYLSGNGDLDLRRLTVAQLSDQDLVEEIRAKYPDAGSGNLVRISRFPLGMPSGWSIDRDYSDGDRVQVTGDPGVVGPSGSPAMRIHAPGGVLVYSAPIGVRWSFEPHVASLSVRGKWEGKLTAMGGSGEWCGDRDLKVDGPTWQRIELPFRPILLAGTHHLRIQGKGTLWIDGLQVERGTQATPYRPQSPCEVALAMPETSASAARVLFDDEAMGIRYAVTGPAAGTRVMSRLVNLYGDIRALPPATQGRGASGLLRLSPFTAHPYGPYRLEAWVQRGGKRVSEVAELVFYRLPRPRYWGKDAPDSFFGTHTLSTTRHLAMAKAVGCNWVRLHDAGTEYIGWSFLEPEKGKWHFRDQDLKRYRDHHLMILGLLSTSPGWASDWGKPCTGYVERYLEPLDLDDWSRAVRTIVARYRGVIDHYEVWNEPWGSSFWSRRFDPKQGTDWNAHFVPSDTPAADYARLQQAAFQAAHSVSPGVTILGFNSTSGEAGERWTRGVLQSGGLGACDAISYHHYETAMVGMPGDATTKAYRSAIGPLLDTRGRAPKPVWMSEGAPLSGDTSNGFYRWTLPYPNTEDSWRLADRLARYIISRRATGEMRAFLYTMHGHNTFGGPMDWSTLVTADGYLNPTAAAHAELAWLTEDARFAGQVVLAPGVFAYFFERKGLAVAAITSAPIHSAYRLPTSTGVRCLDLFGNPDRPGLLLDSRVHYVTSSAGLGALKRALVRSR